MGGLSNVASNNHDLKEPGGFHDLKTKFLNPALPDIQDDIAMSFYPCDMVQMDIMRHEGLLFSYGGNAITSSPLNRLNLARISSFERPFVIRMLQRDSIFGSSTNPLQAAQASLYVGQIASHPARVTEPRHHFPSSTRHMFPLDRHSTQTG